MAERKIIFSNQMQASSWILMVAALMVAGGVLAVDHGSLFAVLFITGLAVFLFLGLIAAIAIAAKRQIAELATDGTNFYIEIFVLFGEGRRFVVPIAEIEHWLWTAHSGPRIRLATLAFVWRGQTYRMPFNGAQVLDMDELAKFAPSGFARAAKI